jgi:ribosomal RNA-processing protein 1
MLQSFLRAFWLTMSRDFNALDRHRLDKYLYLIRCYVGASFDILLQKGFKKGASRGEQNRESTGGSNKSNPKKRKREELEEKAAGDVDAAWSDLEIYIAMLEEGPLCPYNFDPEEGARKTESTMPKGPDGIRYHLLDIWIDELEKFATEPKQSDDGEETATAATTTLKPGVPMELILRPIMRLKRESPNKTARKLAAGVWEDERLVAWGVMEPKETDKDEDDEWGGFD